MREFKIITKVPAKSFYFIRHGETDWNRNNIVMGQIDIPLNNIGIEQAKKATNYIVDLAKENYIDYVYASPLIRAAKTAEIINGQLQLPISFELGLMEMNLGSLEGTNRDYCRQQKHEGRIPADAETFEEFNLRVHNTVTQILNNQFIKVPLIVSHGGVLKSLAEQLTGHQATAANCEIFHFKSPNVLDQSWNVQSCRNYPL